MSGVRESEARQPGTESLSKTAMLPGHLLVVSCDFGGSQSPQGLRWEQFCIELAKLGWCIDVLTWPWRGGRATVPAVTIHEVYPGPYQAMLSAMGSLRSRRLGGGSLTTAGQSISASGDGTGSLNWKGRLDLALRRGLDGFFFGGYRREGLRGLRREVRRLLSRHTYGAVCLVHEPLFPLELAELIRDEGIPVIADLGDPVLAAYTPRGWHKRAMSLEAQVCELASAVVVTNDATRDLLTRRHRYAGSKLNTISQGFVKRPHKPRVREPASPLRIVYTGRFYSFRDPRPLLEAVAQRGRYELHIATPEYPSWLGDHWRQTENVKFIHGLGHSDALELQATADVLIVIGNADPTQTPGKLFEYFATPAPILYIESSEADEAGLLLERLRRGIRVPASVDRISDALNRLCQLRTDGLERHFDLSEEAVAKYAWARLAERYSEVILGAMDRKGIGGT